MNCSPYRETLVKPVIIQTDGQQNVNHNAGKQTTPENSGLGQGFHIHWRKAISSY